MSDLVFTVPAVPVAQPRQRHRVVTANGRTFAQNYCPQRDPVNAFKASVRQSASEAYTGAPLEGPIALVVVFVMPRPGYLVWKKKPMPRCPHTAKPDIENLAKSFFDSLTGLVFRDDAQICRAALSKVIAAGDEQPHVWVKVRTLEQ